MSGASGSGGRKRRHSEISDEGHLYGPPPKHARGGESGPCDGSGGSSWRDEADSSYAPIPPDFTHESITTGRKALEIARGFLEHGPKTPEAYRDMPYDDVFDHIHDPAVVDWTGDWLQCIISHSNTRAAPGEPMVWGVVNAMLYLHAYAIIHTPAKALHPEIEERAALIEASGPVVAAFHGLARRVAGVATRADMEDSRDFRLKLCTYITSYCAWRIKMDIEAEGIINEDARMKEQAVREAREMVAAGTLGVEAIDAAEAKRDYALVNAIRAGVSAREARERLASGVASTSSTRLKATVLKRHDDHVLQGNDYYVKFTNEELAYELLLNPNFRLGGPRRETRWARGETRESDNIFKGVFWDALVADMSEEAPTYAYAIRVLLQVKSRVLQKFKTYTSDCETIRGVLDVPHILEQVRNGALDHAGFVGIMDSVAGVVASVQGHSSGGGNGRGGETVTRWEAIKAEGSLVGDRESHARWARKSLEFVLDGIHMACVDMGNHKIAPMGAMLHLHGVLYMQTHFKRKLDAGTITLDGTREWILHAFAELRGDSAPFVSVTNVSSAPSGAAGVGVYTRVLYYALANLVADHTAWGGRQRGEREYPETMMLDVDRIGGLHDLMHSDIVACVVLTQLHQEVNGRVADRATRADIVRRAGEVIRLEPPNPRGPGESIDSVVAEIGAAMGDEDREATRAMMEKHAVRSHAVYARTARQVKLAWCHALAGTPYTLGVPEPVRFMHGVTLAHAEPLAKIAAMQIKIHGARYDDIIRGAFVRMIVESGGRQGPGDRI